MFGESAADLHRFGERQCPKHATWNLNINYKLLTPFKAGDMAKALGLPVVLFMKLFKECFIIKSDGNNSSLYSG